MATDQDHMTESEFWNVTILDLCIVGAIQRPRGAEQCVEAARRQWAPSPGSGCSQRSAGVSVGVQEKVFWINLLRDS